MTFINFFLLPQEASRELHQPLPPANQKLAMIKLFNSRRMLRSGLEQQQWLGDDLWHVRARPQLPQLLGSDLGRGRLRRAIEGITAVDGYVCVILRDSSHF